MRTVITSSALALLVASCVGAEREYAFTPRLSLGFQSPYASQQSDVDRFSSALITVAGWDTSSAKVESVGGTLFEIPLIGSYHLKDSLYLVGGPSFTRGKGSQTYELRASNLVGRNLTLDVDETLSATGIKLNAGLAVKIEDSIHLEAMPFLGFVNVISDYSWSGFNSSSGRSLSGVDKNNATTTSYGLVVGGHWTHEAGLQLGLRLGYVASEVKIKDAPLAMSQGETLKYQQSGVLLAFDVGWRF